MVGDKAHERAPVVKAIRELGHLVTEAIDGAQAWQECLEHHYDAVFSDYLMPEMNGLELCQRIRENPQGRYTYVIICSTQSLQQHVVAGFESGVDDYIAKPVSSLELKARLISARRVTLVHNELTRKNKELSALTEELRAQSRSDTLTGVGNRLRFVEDVSSLVEEPEPFFLAMCDIDNFKRYNDSYGHLEGDKVLRAGSSPGRRRSPGGVPFRRRRVSGRSGRR